MKEEEGFKITQRTSLSEIRDQVLLDFGVAVSNDTAHAIRDAARNGCLMWTAEHLCTTDSSRLKFTRK